MSSPAGPHDAGARPSLAKNGVALVLTSRRSSSAYLLGPSTMAQCGSTAANLGDPCLLVHGAETHVKMVPGANRQ